MQNKRKLTLLQTASLLVILSIAVMKYMGLIPMVAWPIIVIIFAVCIVWAVAASERGVKFSVVNLVPRPTIAYPGLVVIGTLFMLPYLHHWNPELLWHPLKEFGFALIISGITGFTIDVYSRRKHEELSKSLQRDVFDAIYERRLTKLILDAFKRDILSTRFVCLRSVVHVSITIDSVNTERVIVSAKNKREIKNVSGVRDAFPIINQFLSPVGDVSPYAAEFLFLQCGDEVFVGETLKAKVAINERGCKQIMHTCMLSPEEVVNIEIEYSLSMDRIFCHSQLRYRLKSTLLALNAIREWCTQ